MSDTCCYCGGPIDFRWIDGVVVPLHQNGGCSGGSWERPPRPPTPPGPPDEGFVRDELRGPWAAGHAATDLGEPLTYPTTCPYCGARIFFHTNGNGDVVFFDALGPPWPKHACLASDFRTSEGSNSAWTTILEIASLRVPPSSIPVPRERMMTLVLGWATSAEGMEGQTLRGVVVRTEEPRIAYREEASGFGRTQCWVQMVDLFVSPSTVICLANVSALPLEVGQAVEVTLTLQWFESRRLLVAEQPIVLKAPGE